MEELEKALGSKPYPHYGSRECGLGGAVTCPAHAGMHLRENHIIPEIIDKNGNVLPEGQYGELVITTIGSDAMPLIRYRTGDFTRILPKCPCGGISRRIDTVSRREGAVSMKVLDSALFQLPELVDYRVTYGDMLSLDIYGKKGIDQDRIHGMVKKLYPKINVMLSLMSADRKQTPLYPGKRYVIQLHSD